MAQLTAGIYAEDRSRRGQPVGCRDGRVVGRERPARRMPGDDKPPRGDVHLRERRAHAREDVRKRRDRVVGRLGLVGRVDDRRPVAHEVADPGSVALRVERHPAVQEDHDRSRPAGRTRRPEDRGALRAAADVDALGAVRDVPEQRLRHGFRQGLGLWLGRRRWDRRRRGYRRRRRRYGGRRSLGRLRLRWRWRSRACRPRRWRGRHGGRRGRGRWRDRHGGHRGRGGSRIVRAAVPEHRRREHADHDHHRHEHGDEQPAHRTLTVASHAAQSLLAGARTRAGACARESKRLRPAVRRCRASGSCRNGTGTCRGSRASPSARWPRRAVAPPPHA